MVQARITKSSPWAASRSLVFCDKILFFWVRGFLLNEDIKEGYPLKRRYFAVIGLYTVGATYMHVGYKHTPLICRTCV